jgi:hypothetical protein
MLMVFGRSLRFQILEMLILDLHHIRKDLVFNEVLTFQDVMVLYRCTVMDTKQWWSNICYQPGPADA